MTHNLGYSILKEHLKYIQTDFLYVLKPPPFHATTRAAGASRPNRRTDRPLWGTGTLFSATARACAPTAGVLAKVVIPGDNAGGIILTILLGIGGAFLGGFLGVQLGFGGPSGFDLRSIGMAFGGAVLLLLLYSFLT